MRFVLTDSRIFAKICSWKDAEEEKQMGKNVYVTPKNRDKWNNVHDEHNTTGFGNKQQSAAERARQLKEKYKQQKSKKQQED